MPYSTWYNPPNGWTAKNMMLHGMWLYGHEYDLCSLDLWLYHGSKACYD